MRTIIITILSLYSMTASAVVVNIDFESFGPGTFQPAGTTFAT
ncbi:MAG: hypothetical protein QGG65_05230 [Gammaproteobacteria bacterium]|nr:hypothetical protein [Gammaproteobacteria bacterium]HJP04977.1 hypothetical protein [Gammaproteobacteria bacterium]